MLGSVAVLGRMAWSCGVQWGFRHRCSSAHDASTCACVSTLAARLGIRRPVRILTSRRLAAPVVFGLWRPTLVLPAEFTDDFNARQQEAILVHELAHLAAGDPVWQSISLAICALSWWHPLAWWCRLRLRAASEAAADEASLLLPDGPCTLAEVLVRLGRRLVRARPRAGLSVEGGGFQSGLGRRVERLLHLGRFEAIQTGTTGERSLLSPAVGGRIFGRRAWRAPGRARLAFTHAMLPVALALIAILGTAWAPARVSFTQGETTMGVLKTSWRCSLAATALWALLGSNPCQAVAQERGERPQPAAGDRAEQQQKLDSMIQKIQQLEREGKHEEAEHLKREASELAQKIHPGGRVSPEREQMYRQLQAMKQKVEELEKQGKHDEAEHVKREASELMQKFRRGGPESGPAGAPLAEPEREKLRQQLQAIRQKVEQLEREGKHEDADRLKQEAQAIMARMYPRGSEPGPGARRSPSSGDVEARVQHLRAAAENLKAAGLQADADRLLRMAEQIKNEPRSESRPNYEPTTRRTAASDVRNEARSEGRPNEGRRPPADSRSGPGAGNGVQELRSELQQMHREIQELREQIKRLAERGGSR
jgi:phage shock protein A